MSLSQFEVISTTSYTQGLTVQGYLRKKQGSGHKEQTQALTIQLAILVLNGGRFQTIVWHSSAICDEISFFENLAVVNIKIQAIGFSNLVRYSTNTINNKITKRDYK
jgi:hypothetical protein